MTSLPPLRDYQVDVIERAAPLAAAGVLLQLPTGAGKTRIGLEIAARHLQRAPGRRVLWLAHRDELVEQPAAKLRAMGASVATLRPGAPAAGEAPIVVASMQTLVARGASAAPPATLVIYDEARHVGDAPIWGEVARAVGEGRPRVGLDATPMGDLTGLFSSMVVGPSVASLIAAGHLVRPVHRAPSEQVDALAAHPIDAYQRLCDGGRALIFCRDVAHATATAEEARYRGITAAAVHGGTPAEERRRAVEGYAAGAIDILVNCQVFTDGFDAPATEAVIIARGVSNEATWVQIGGRGLRSSPGKTRCLIIDLLGLFWRFGPLDADRSDLWRLDGTPARRSAALPPVVRCPACLAWGPPSSTCPGCGRVTPPAPPPRVRARDLVEVRAREGDERKRAALVRYVREALSKGHKPWSAAFRWKGVFGEMPRREEMESVIREVEREAAA